MDLTPPPVHLPIGIDLTHVREGVGSTLIFIHGAMGGWRAHAPQWEAFTARVDCISHSRRYSHHNPNPIDTRHHNGPVDARDLEGLMDAFGL